MRGGLPYRLEDGSILLLMWFSKPRMYLDYASATPVLPQALEAMNEAESTFGNPGSLHKEGVEARRVLESARERIAQQIGCKSRQIFFTSGLTESNNLAILGYARALDIKGTLRGSHWITSSIEHSSVLSCFSEIERLGGAVTHVEPLPSGLISEQALQRALRPSTVFVSIGWANNEIGTIQRLAALSRTIRAHESAHMKIHFHSDAGQAPLYEAAQVHSLGVDSLSVGSGKLYGPRTIGALFLDDPSVMAPTLLGGGQEKGLRSGTEKIAPAIGFAVALEEVAKERLREAKRLKDLRDSFVKELISRYPDLVVNGDLRHALPHMLNVSVPGEKTGEYLALRADHLGIALSTKSACDEGNQFSHVVDALSEDSWRSRNTLRLSFGRETTTSDIAQALKVFDELLA